MSYRFIEQRRRDNDAPIPLTQILHQLIFEDDHGMEGDDVMQYNAFLYINMERFQRLAKVEKSKTHLPCSHTLVPFIFTTNK